MHMYMANQFLCAWQVPLYQHAGFEVVGPSDIVHGKDPWLEMKIDVEGRAANSSYRPQHMIEALA